MKKALMMGVSGAAMLVAVSAQAGDRYVDLDQDSTQINPQIQFQAQAGRNDARGGNGGRGGNATDDFADGGNGGNGGRATAGLDLEQEQEQESSQASAQGQTVEFGGGLADANSGDEGTAISGDHNDVVAHSATARDRGMAANQGGLNVFADRGAYAAGRDNIYMTNRTDMHGHNTIDDIDLHSGDANGGKGYGGNADNYQKAENENYGHAGNAYASNKGTIGGWADSDADATNKAYQDNFAINNAKGGFAHADADADADSYGKAYSDSDARARNFGASVPIANGNSVAVSVGRFGEAESDDGGDTDANIRQRADADSKAKSWVSAPAVALAPAKASGGDAKTGDIKQKNSADQTAKALSAARGGDATADAKASGGDNDQKAASWQSQKATGGNGTGGNGGDSSVHFGSGGFGSLSMSSLHGVSSVALNTGVQANQFSAFSVNANARF